MKIKKKLLMCFLNTDSLSYKAILSHISNSLPFNLNFGCVSSEVDLEARIGVQVVFLGVNSGGTHQGVGN